MKRLSTLLAILYLPLFLSANGSPELRPEQSVNLINHLSTINSGWLEASIDCPGLFAEAQFTSDTERIAEHLLKTVDYLRTHSDQVSDAGKLAERMELLDILELYANQRSFPINTFHTTRIPYFIDYQNTPCAVGHLLIESGHSDFAERVHTEMNNAYIADIPYPELPLWADAHGFSLSELALIQPAYPPSTNWLPLQEGVNGEVIVLLPIESTGEIVIAGNFTDASGLPVMNTAIWNGSSYEALGNNLSGVVRTGVIFEDEIYLGGQFANNADLARWDGNTWQISTVFGGSAPPEVTDLLVDEGSLYAAGVSGGFAGLSYGVKKLTVSGWQLIPGDFNNEIHDMTIYNFNLVVAGEFTDFNFETTDFTYLAMFVEGEWQAIGSELQGQVNAVSTYRDTLYVGGKIGGDVISGVGMQYYDATSGDWVSVYDNAFATPQEEFRNFSVWNDMLYVSGNIEIFDNFTVLGNHAGVLTTAFGQTSITPIIWSNGAINQIALLGDDLYCGGNFAGLMGSEIPYNNLTYATAPNSTSNLQETSFKIYPNPAKDELTVDLGDLRTEGIRIYDVSGRLRFARRGISNGLFSIDVNHLGTGMYIVEITTSDDRRKLHQKLIVE